jgi:glycosyltransferase involved in cell wall biosynthesis
MGASTDSRGHRHERLAVDAVSNPVLQTGSSHAWTRAANQASVAILMCTYNGENYLAEQLDSFARQTHKNWRLWISDDNSQDLSLEILKDYSARWDQDSLKVLSGPGKGFVANFLSLTCCPDVDAEFFAWSDQDDIWQASKLQVALNWLQSIPVDVPALYCGRTQIVRSDGQVMGMSPRFALPTSFANALVQSIAGGNTMVFNRAARDLVREAGSKVDVPSHDWWLYQLISGAGGKVHYDPQPLLQYRQHDENVIGSNSGCIARLRRLNLLFKGRFGEWNELNIRALERMRHRLAPEHQRTLEIFKAARGQWLPQRMLGILRARLYRQTLMGNLGLYLATLLKKI